MVVNTWQHARAATGRRTRAAPVDDVIGTLLQGRFYPIFSLLFGMSFVLFLDAARERTAHPRLALFMRLVVLACFGLLHQLVNDGEVLLPYAVFGAGAAAARRPSCRAGPRWPPGSPGSPRRCGGAATPWLLIAGLFLLGMALVRYRPSPRLLVPSFAVARCSRPRRLWLHLEPAAAPPGARPVRVGAASPRSPAPPRTRTGLRCWWRGRAARVSAVLEPLGRMALTNYLSSTPFILAALPLLAADPTRLSVVGCSPPAVLAAQVAFGRWWLRTVRYGPLEWVWRCPPGGGSCPTGDRADPARYGGGRA